MVDDASISNVDWSAIAEQFRLLRSEVKKSRYPSQAEIDRYKASLAAPARIRSPLIEQLDANQRHVIADADSLRMLQYSSQVLGLSDPDSALPRWVRASLTNHMEVVERCIAERSLTLEFVHSWGEVKFAFGILSAVQIDDEAARASFFKKMKAAVEGGDTTVQKHWYAHWLQKNGLFEEPPYEKRDSSNDEIAELCLDICEGRRKAIDYPVSWFRSLIYISNENGKSPTKNTPGELEYRLNRVYLDMSINYIKSIIANPAVKLTELPPLSPDSYPTIPPS